MKKPLIISICLLAGLLSPALASISGDYVEVRTADVWTGPCFANGEVNLTGKEAILGWKIRQGSWEGISLDGLKVVAVVRANGTLGDPYSDQLPASSVILVDESADPRQQEGLVRFARKMAEGLLDDVVWVKAVPIEMETSQNRGFAAMTAGDFARLETRALSHHDIHCGNESVYYPPLIDLESATPAYTLVHRFSGQGLNSTWSSPDKRSAFIGSFSR